jgi:hypothetical protein
MGHILNRADFLKESLWKGVIDRSKSGEVRKEDILGNHSFTDGNGTFHKHGIKPDEYQPYDAITKVVWWHLDRKSIKDVIDLNVIDTSELTSMVEVFSLAFTRLMWPKDYDKEGYRALTAEEVDELKFDCSGWQLDNMRNITFKGLFKDINIDNWTIPEGLKIKFGDFKDSYYENNPPSWYNFDIKEWVASAVYGRGAVSHNKYGVDKVRTKELGKKCYWVKFTESFRCRNIPECVSIIDITNENNRHDRVFADLSGIETLRGLPESVKKESKVCIELCLNDLTDKELILPEGIDQLSIKESDNVDLLPTVLPYSISLVNSKQLGHVTEVNGWFNCGNSGITSLKGCPKKVTGHFDCHNSKLTDLVGAPEYVGSDFSCSNMGSIKSLKGCPKYVGGDFNFYSTGVTDIDDFPEEIGGGVYLSGCCHLNSFVGIPEGVIKGNLDIGYCNVKSLEGLPASIGGYYFIKNLTLNGKSVSKNDFLEMCPHINPEKVKNSKYD